MSFISSPPANPAGSTTQLQRNNAGVFGASTITDDGSTIIVKPGANSTSAIKFTKADGTTVLGVFDTTNATFSLPNGTTLHPSLAGTGNINTGLNFNTGTMEMIAGGNLVAAWTGSGLGVQVGSIVVGDLPGVNPAIALWKTDQNTLKIIAAQNLAQHRDLSLRKIVNYGTETATATAGWGVPAIYAAGRATAQVAANASVATFTVGSADGSFEVSANVLVTTATTHNFTVTCAYTDEGNTARTLTLNFASLAGALATPIINTGGTVPYEGVPMHIRCKAATTITIATTGVFTAVAYNVEGIIKQTA